MRARLLQIFLPLLGFFQKHFAPLTSECLMCRFWSLELKCCANLAARSQGLPVSVCCQASPFLLAEVLNHVFSCVYKTDLREVFDIAVEFMGFYRDLSIHFAL